MISIIAKAFGGRPDLGQFAINARWEHAWRIGPSDPVELDTLSRYLNNSNEIAFELFTGNSFLGVRFEGETNEIFHLAAKAWECFSRCESGIDFIAGMEQTAGIKLYEGKPSFMEIGAINAWKSVGAFQLTIEALARRPFDHIWSDILHSDAGKERSHGKALELAYVSPVSHWAGLSISEHYHPNKISKGKLLKVLSELNSIE